MVEAFRTEHGTVGKRPRQQVGDATSRFVSALVFALLLQHCTVLQHCVGVVFVRRLCLSSLFQHWFAGLGENDNAVIFIGKRLHELFSQPSNSTLARFDACSKDAITREAVFEAWSSSLNTIKARRQQCSVKGHHLATRFPKVWRRLTGMGSRAKQCHVSTVTWGITWQTMSCQVMPHVTLLT